MRTNRLSLVRLALFALLPLCMSDVESAGAASLDPNGASSADASHESDSPSSADTASTSPATTTDVSQDAAATQSQAPAVEAGTAMSGEPLVDSSSGTSNESPATTAPQTSAPSAQSSAPTGEVAIDPVVPVLNTPERAAPVNENTGKVEVAADAHAEAKDRFAGLLAKLHQFEDEAIDELRTDLLAIATLLHLHTRASSSAATTGTYKPGDLS